MIPSTAQLTLHQFSENKYDFAVEYDPPSYINNVVSYDDDDDNDDDDCDCDGDNDENENENDDHHHPCHTKPSSSSSSSSLIA